MSPGQCCGSGIFIRIPDPNFFHPGSRIRIFSIPDPGCLSRIRILIFYPFRIPEFFPFRIRVVHPGSGLFIPDPDPDFLPIPHPGSRGQGTGSRIRIRNTGPGAHFLNNDRESQLWILNPLWQKQKKWVHTCIWGFARRRASGGRLLTTGSTFLLPTGGASIFSRTAFFTPAGLGWSRLAEHIFDSLITNFRVKSTIILGVFSKKILYLFKNKNYLQMYDICGYRKW